MLDFKTIFKLIFSVLLLSMFLLTPSSSWSQGLIRERLQQKFAQKQNSEANQNHANSYKTSKIAGLDVAIWEAKDLSKPAPLVIFSHGFGGVNVQSKFIMQALADKGYLVMAPNHRDAHGLTAGLQPAMSFQKSAQWSDKVYIDRHDDIVLLFTALKKDHDWKGRIDWSKVALCGHSLGGYTVLALAGAWPSWKQNGIKAILALSPYCQPFVINGDLANMGIPVMYQGGTRDFGITPTIKSSGGAYSKTPSPAYFVEFEKLGHFGWTNFNKNKGQRDLINYYCLAFLDRYVKGNKMAKPDKKLVGVRDLQAK